MDPSIILAGQPVNVLGAMRAGTELAGATNALRQQNTLRQFLGQNGQAVMQGDPAALGQYASIAGPEAAMGVQQGRLDMDRTRQVMRYADTAEGRAVAEHAMRLTDAQRQAEAERIRSGLSQAAIAFQQGNLDGLNATFEQFGLPPVQSLEQAVPILTQADEAYQIMTRSRELTGPGENFRMATPEEAAQYGAKAGQFGPDGRFYPITPPSNTSLTVAPDGTVRWTEGATQESTVNPSAPETMLATIDGILTDPALDTSTGVLSMLQAVPGTPQYRFGTKVRQLQGQAFLQAFESLKGGGQITEIEGTKATEAIGRLDSAQSPEDYRAALTELRDILVRAQRRPVGWAETQSGSNLGADFEAFSQNPSVRAAAERYGVTPEEMWAVQQGAQGQ